MESHFSTLPLELLVDLLVLLDKRSVAQFASVSKNQKYYFEKQDGMWKLLVCKLFHWGPRVLIIDLELNKVQRGSKIDWAKEYRVSAFYNDRIRNNQIYADPSQDQLKYFSVLDADHNCYRFDDVDIEETPGIPFFYFNLQSKFPLYPLPIGNFSVAYYEIELLDNSDGYVYIGAALDGFVNGIPGVGRNSYSYGMYDGRIALENDFGVAAAPECTNGDVAGLGIDFNKNAVFFTKNGKLVFEATKTTLDAPLLNLKSLHAAVGLCGTREFKVNVGSAPFKFDILKYQLEKAKTKLYSTTRFYSDVLREHLAAFSESETVPVIDNFALEYAPMDYNLPPAGARLNPFLYMLLYMQIPAGFVPSGDLQGNDLGHALRGMTHCRAVTHANNILPSFENTMVQSIFDYLAGCLDVQQKEMSFKEYCDEIMYKSFTTIGTILQILVAACTKDLLADYGCTYSQFALAFGLMGNFPTEHFIAQITARSFLDREDPLVKNTKVLNEEMIQRAYSLGIHKLIYLRRTAIIIAATEKIRLKYLPQKKLEKTEAMRVYGHDSLLESLFDSVLKRMASLEDESFIPPHSTIIISLLADAKAKTFDHMLVYGLYAFDLQHLASASKKDFIADFTKQLSALATDELKLDYLTEALKIWMDPSGTGKDTVLMILRLIFGYDFDPKQLPEVGSVIAQVESFLRAQLKKYEHKIKKKQRTDITNPRTKLVVGASIAIAAIAFVSVFVYTKRRPK